jgi:SPP1 gp7 family putative phage head morphogenesis protein
MAENTSNAKVGKSYLPWAAKSISRTRQDIKSWNTGLNMARMAEHPQNWPLQLTYDECDLDPLISSQWNNRKNQVFSADFSLKKPNGEIDEEQTLLLKKHPLYRMLTNAALDSIIFGYNLVELAMKGTGDQAYLGADLIPRYNVVPQTGMFYKDYGDTANFIKYRELPEFGVWILEFNSGNLGLMNKLVAPALFTRFAEASWSELCEIYGIPPRVLKTNTQDSTMLKRAESMMRDMGSAAWFIIDETESFDFAKGASTNGDVYKSLINHCRDKICNLLSGGMIGQDSENGNRAKDQVSMDMLWLLVQSDMAMLEETWNNTIIPALIRHGVITGDVSFEFDQAEDVNQLWTFVQGLLPHYEIDPEWIKEKFGVDVTAAKVQNDLTTTLALALSKAVPPPPGGAGGGDGDPDFFPPAPQVGACCGTHHTLLPLKGELEGVKGALPLQGELKGVKSDKLITRVAETSGQLVFDPETFQSTAKTLKQGFNKKLDGRKIRLDANFSKVPNFGKAKKKLSIGTAYGIDSPHLLASFEMNLFRFSAGKTLAQVQALNQAFQSAPSFDIFKINANRIGDVFNDRWLRTEFDTAVLVGESANNYYSLLQDVDVFPYWEYRTAGDAAVREEHATLDGLILPADDPRWSKIFPPNGWNCRCYVVARTREEILGVNFTDMQQKADTYFGSDDFERASKSGFGVNRATSGEVFTANQQYISGKNLTQSTKMINDLEPKDYGLKTAEDLLEKATRSLPESNKALSEFIGELDVLNGKPILTDYSKRALNFPAQISTGEDLLEALRDTLSKPSEVWVKTRPAGYQLTYFNYYKGETFQVIAELENLELNIVLWRKIKSIESKRKGMLLR